MNEQVTVHPVPKKVTAILDRGKYQMPADVRDKIDNYWQAYTADKPSYFNGEVFRIMDTQHEGDELVLHMAETDYAHHLYTAKVGDLGEYNNNSIYPTTMVITTDDKLVFGRMGQHTGRAGQIQCCGGGLDFKDVGKGGLIDITGTAGRELSEELGVDVHDPKQVISLEPHYITAGGSEHKMAVVHIARMALASDELLAHYQKFLETEKQPEFDKIYCIDRTEQAAVDFIAKNQASMSEEFSAILTQVVQ